jgi:2-dehydro-3-deoxygluconokinase
MSDSGGRALTLGETMALLDPLEEGEIAPGFRFQLRIAGAESNFGVALRRLGVDVTWISRLGDDRFGEVVLAVLESEGLDLRFVRRDDEAPTGVFFKWRSGGRSHVVYYRRGSAASRLAPGDVPEEALADVALVHLTGITTALSDGARALVEETARRARERGITVVFDPNYRPALWRAPEEAEAAQREVLGNVDWYLCGLEEGSRLFGAGTAEELVEALRSVGVRAAAIRVGERGALVTRGEELVPVPPLRLTDVRDEIGAGDGFAAGFAYGLLRGWDPEACARAGNVIAAAALSGTGDWETFPHLAEVEEQLQPMQGGAR